MIQRLVHALIATRNEAADDLLLRALELGEGVEKRLALGALIRRGTTHGLSGVVERYATLPDVLKLAVLERIHEFGAALSDCGRSPNIERRLAAMRLIALGRHGRLGYVILDNLGVGDERLQRGAAEAIVALARWAAVETRNLQKGSRGAEGPELARAHHELLEQRDDIEELVYMAFVRQKGRFGGELTRAALLLADCRTSRTAGIFRRARHPGRTPMERHLQLPPASEHVEAWLIAAAHGSLRAEFVGTFPHVHERPVLDALLRKSHWLKDAALEQCVGQVMGGRWMDDVSLARDLKRRPATDVEGVAQWVSASGCAEVVKDALLIRMLQKGEEDAGARLAVLRAAMARPRGASVATLKEMLRDSDERLRRMAVREIARRRPAGYHNMLMGSLEGAPASVRRIIGRAAGEAGFRAFWKKYDGLDPATRRSAGRAVIRIVPDATRKLATLLTGGPVADRIRAIRLARDTELVEGLRGVVLRLFADTDPHVRSSAVSAAADLRPVPAEALVERLERDTDARVRANAIETLEGVADPGTARVFAARTTADDGRERANAIKALYATAPASAVRALGDMLRDARPKHRISALWVVNRLRTWDRLMEVGRIAKDDPELTVRRYALGVLKQGADELRGATRQGGRMNMLFFLAVAGQDETLRAINEQVGAGGVDGPGLEWVAATALVLALLLLVIRWRRGVVDSRPKVTSDPKKLMREIRKETGLSRRDHRKLKREAEAVARRRQIEIADPMLLVLCPSLRRK